MIRVGNYYLGFMHYQEPEGSMPFNRRAWVTTRNDVKGKGRHAETMCFLIIFPPATTLFTSERHPLFNSVNCLLLVLLKL